MAMYVLIRLGLSVVTSIRLTDILIDIFSWYDVEILLVKEEEVMWAGFGNLNFLNSFRDQSLALLHKAFTFTPMEGSRDAGYLKISTGQFEDARLLNWGKYSVDFLKPVRNPSSVVVDPSRALEILHVNALFLDQTISNSIYLHLPKNVDAGQVLQRDYSGIIPIRKARILTPYDIFKQNHLFEPIINFSGEIRGVDFRGTVLQEYNTLMNAVKNNPEYFINRDPQLVVYRSAAWVAKFSSYDIANERVMPSALPDFLIADSHSADKEDGKVMTVEIKSYTSHLPDKHSSEQEKFYDRLEKHVKYMQDFTSATKKELVRHFVIIEINSSSPGCLNDESPEIKRLKSQFNTLTPMDNEVKRVYQARVNCVNFLEHSGQVKLTVKVFALDLSNQKLIELYSNRR